MNKRIIIALSFLISATVLSAQDESEYTDDRPWNTIYINFGGDASISSLNYERLFFKRPKFFFTGALGIGYNKNADDEFEGSIFQIQHSQYLTIPHHITMNVGKENSFFEFGIGGIGIIGNTNKNYFLCPIIGYRFHPLISIKLNFRIYVSFPFDGFKNVEIWWFPIGLSLGTNF